MASQTDVVAQVYSSYTPRLGTIVELSTPWYSGDLQKRNDIVFSSGNVTIREYVSKGQSDLVSVFNRLNIRLDDKNYYG
jgi:hypothetical protein